MKCEKCKEDKLPKEFPSEHLTEECADEHPLLHCLRCLTASVRDAHQCPQCGAKISEDNERYIECLETLESLFSTVSVDDEAPISTDDESKSQIFITTLSNKCLPVPYKADQTIQDLKEFVKKELNTPCAKQCLLYNDIELKTKGKVNEDLKLEDYQKVLKLKDYSVEANSTIYLLVLLDEIPEDYDQMVFHVAHGCLEDRKDVLDASVLLYSGSKCKYVFDVKNRTRIFCRAVKHSGDTTDETKQMASHTITVSVKEIPAMINLLVFTLSARNSKRISAYPDITVELFDKRCPDKTLLSDDTINHNVETKAIIVCYLFNYDGKWNAISVKRPSDGRAMEYDQLKKNISECGFFKELAADHENKKTGRCVIS